MKKSAPIPETLAGMYHTDIPFLEGNSVPVIKRKFNWIPTGGKGDPPRALTDEPPLKTHYYEQVVVKSDFPKTMAYRMYGDGFKQFPDGTYHDAVMGMEEDYLERQKALKQVFAPSDVYMFMRADKEQYTQEMIKDYFRAKYEEREEAEEMFLTKYGLAPHEVKTVMAQRRVEAAAKALESARTTDKIPVHRMGLNIRREDLIADRFMDNSIELISADDRRGAGNAQPWAKGHEDWTRGYDETSPYSRMTSGASSRASRKESASILSPAASSRRESVDLITFENRRPSVNLLGFPPKPKSRSDIISELDVERLRAESLRNAIPERPKKIRKGNDNIQAVIEASLRPKKTMVEAASTNSLPAGGDVEERIDVIMKKGEWRIKQSDFNNIKREADSLVASSEAGIRKKRRQFMKDTQAKYPGLTQKTFFEQLGLKPSFGTGK
jgi:hypothetical protein